MNKVMTIAAVTLMLASSAVYACGGCGCEDNKDENKAEKTECGSGCKSK